MFKYLIIFVFLIFGTYSLADIFDYPAETQTVVESLPQFNSISCKFTQEKVFPQRTLQSGGNFHFIKEKGDFKVAFIHSDSDLYSSTKTTLDNLKGRIQKGTVIVFDEYLNYPGWEENEFKAFQEFIQETGLKYEYIGYVFNAKQTAVRIL